MAKGLTGSSAVEKAAAALSGIMKLLGGAPAPLTGRGIKDALSKSEHGRDAIDAALKLGVADGQLLGQNGPRNAMLYRVSASVRSVSECPDERPGRPDGPRDTCTRRELAEVLDVNMQTVTKWERDGLPVSERGRKGKPSQYREADVRAWLAGREVAAQTSGVVDVARQRARKDQAQAQLAEQEFRKRAGDLLERDKVEKAWGRERDSVRTKLLALPQMVADKVFRASKLDGVAGVEAVLADAIADVLRELADPSRVQDDEDDEEGALVEAGVLSV